MSEQDQLPEQDEADLPQLQQCDWMPEPGAKPIDGDRRVQVHFQRFTVISGALIRKLLYPEDHGMPTQGELKGLGGRCPRLCSWGL